MPVSRCLMTSPRWRRWSRNAQPSPDPACDRPRPFRLCDAAFRQSRARQHLCWRDGERPRHPEADLAVAPGRCDPLRFASDPYEPRLLGALRAAPIPLDATRGEPARSWPLHPIPADQPRDRHPRRAQPIWDREGICAGTRGFLGQLALARRAASNSVADRLDSRLPRRPFLAAGSSRSTRARRACCFRSRCFCLRWRCSATIRAASGPWRRFRTLPGWRARRLPSTSERRLRTRSFWTSARGRSLSWPWRWPPRSPPGPSDTGGSTASARSG